MEVSGTVTKMEVKPGYKKTEVGMIPRDWTAQALGDKIQLVSGQHILAKDYHTEEVGMPYLTGPADFLNGQAIVSKWTSSPKKVAQLNDILLTVKGSGAGSVFKLEISETAISRQLMAIRSDSIPHDYIYYFLIFQKESLSARAVGNLIPGISRQDVLKYVIPLPPTLAEQRAIATALSDVDQLITTLGRLIDKKKAMKQGAMQELLTGRKRLPGYGKNNEYGVTELGLIPKDWVIKKVPEITQFGVAGIKIGPFGSQLKKELLVKAGYKVYGQENVFEKDVEIGNRFIDRNHFNKLKSCELTPGDFIISMMGTIGKCMIMPTEAQPGIMDSHLLRLKLDELEIQPELLIHLFSSPIILNQVRRLSVGGIMDGLSSKIIKQIQLPLASSIEEQRAIAQVLSDMDAGIEALEQKRDKYKAIKQGMMQELLTGKTRLV